MGVGIDLFAGKGLFWRCKREVNMGCGRGNGYLSGTLLRKKGKGGKTRGKVSKSKGSEAQKENERRVEPETWAGLC